MKHIKVLELNEANHLKPEKGYYNSPIKNIVSDANPYC